MNKKEQTDNIIKQIYVNQTKGIIDVSQKKIFWTNFAEQTGGLFEEKQTISRDLTTLNLKITLENGNLKFIESDTHPLKVVCEIKTEKQLEFAIIKEDYIDKLLKVFGQQDITISHPEFDKKYIVKSDDEAIVKTILNSELIIDLILKTNIFSISCERNESQSNLEIMGVLGRSVNSIEEMNDLYDLFRAIISQINKL